MDFKIIWSDPAIESLGEIVRHIARDNPTAALELGRSLVNRVEPAAHFPQIGPLFSRSADVEYRCLTHGNYRLYYRLISGRDVIEVVAIRHTSREQPRF